MKFIQGALLSAFWVQVQSLAVPRTAGSDLAEPVSDTEASDIFKRDVRSHFNDEDLGIGRLPPSPLITRDIEERDDIDLLSGVPRTGAPAPQPLLDEAVVGKTKRGDLNDYIDAKEGRYGGQGLEKRAGNGSGLQNCASKRSNEDLYDIQKRAGAGRGPPKCATPSERRDNEELDETDEPSNRDEESHGLEISMRKRFVHSVHPVTEAAKRAESPVSDEDGGLSNLTLSSYRVRSVGVTEEKVDHVTRGAIRLPDSRTDIVG